MNKYKLRRKKIILTHIHLLIHNIKVLLILIIISKFQKQNNNGKKNFIRGDHAHKRCSQFLFPVLGRIKIEYVSKNKKGSIILDHSKREGCLLKPLTWCKIKFLTQNAILLVACDMEYEFSDYIEKYTDFLKIIKKKK